MQGFADRLRERARELGLSDAEVARRAGLSERRYSYYTTGEAEPNLATLIPICDGLRVTPNDLFLPGTKPPAQSVRQRLVNRITTAARQLGSAQLEIAACQIECLMRSGPRRQPAPRASAR